MLDIADLSEAERKLWAAFPRGEQVDLRGGDTDGATNGQHWGEERRVRAEVIAALLLGAARGEAGQVPALHLTGAHISGQLDLRWARVEHPAALEACWFAEPIDLREAHTRTIRLERSVFRALKGTALRVTGNLILDGCRTNKVVLNNAEINGHLAMEGARLINPRARALNASGVVVSGDVVCAHGFATEGEVRLIEARITGQLDFSGARLSNPERFALQAYTASVGGSVFCTGGFRAAGELEMIGVRIGGDVYFDDARLVNPHGQALRAERLTVDGDVFFRNATARGLVNIEGANLGGVLWMSGTRLINPGEDALSAGSLSVAADVSFDAGFHAEGAVHLYGATIRGRFSLEEAILGGGEESLRAPRLSVGRDLRGVGLHAHGTVDLSRVHIGADLDLSGAALRHATGHALFADDLGVDGSVFCGAGFRGVGTVRLLRARIGGQWNLDGAVLQAPTELDADGSRPAALTGDLVSAHDIRAEGTVVDGMVRLLGARVTHEVDLETIQVSNPGEFALTLEGMTAERLFLPPYTDIDGAVDLIEARVTELREPIPALDEAYPDSRLRVVRGRRTRRVWPSELYLENLEFTRLGVYEPAADRLPALRLDPRGYFAQPYENLAAYYRRLGHDDQAREVLLAKHRHQRENQPWLPTIWGWIQDVTVGYGYKPLRPAIWLILLLAVGSVYFTRNRPAPITTAGRSPSFDPVAYALDLLIPVVNLGQEEAFDPDFMSYFLMLSGWVLASTVFAGISRALTRS